jgi:hypothetical protein
VADFAELQNGHASAGEAALVCLVGDIFHTSYNKAIDGLVHAALPFPSGMSVEDMTALAAEWAADLMESPGAAPQYTYAVSHSTRTSAGWCTSSPGRGPRPAGDDCTRAMFVRVNGLGTLAGRNEMTERLNRVGARVIGPVPWGAFLVACDSYLHEPERAMKAEAKYVLTLPPACDKAMHVTPVRVASAATASWFPPACMLNFIRAICADQNRLSAQ